MRDIPFQRYAGRVFANGVYGLPSLGAYRVPRGVALVLGALAVLVLLRALGFVDDDGLFLAAGPIGLLQSLQAEANDLEQERDAIIAAAESRAANGGAKGFTDDERARLEAVRTRLAAIDTDTAILEAERATRVTAPTVPADAVAAVAAAGTPASDAAPTPFATLGEFLHTVRSSTIRAKKGGTADPRLVQIQEWGDRQLQRDAAVQGASETIGSDGGFLVQTDISNRLLDRIHEVGILARRVRRLPVGANSNGIKINVVDETSRATGSRWGGVQVYRAAEGDAATKSKPKFKQLEMSLQKLIGLFYATDELLGDTTLLTAVAEQAFTEEFAFKTDDEIFRGTGAGEMLGVLNAAATVSVAKEAGQAADTVLAENVEKMYARMHARSLSRAEWFINQALWPQIFALHRVIGTSGVPLYIPAGGLSQAPFGTLLGRPVNPIEHASAPGDVGDISFLDLDQYVVIDKGGVSRASSIHVEFLTDQEVFRWTVRNNGQPGWTSALTPYKGSDTVSPFITLAAR